MSRTEELFDQLHLDSRFLPSYPNEEVIKWRKRKLDTNIKKILIIGCGGGRHVAYFSKEGFEVTAIDLSIRAIQETKLRLENENLKAKLLKVNSGEKLPFQQNYFDAILAFSVLYYQSLTDFLTSISEITRILTKNGQLFFNLRTLNDWRFKYASKVGDHYILLSHSDEKEKLIEEGLPQIFYEDNTLPLILEENYEIKLGGYSSFYGEKLNENVFFECTKKK